MGLNMAAGLGGMLKDGHKHIEGVDMAIGKNIDACKQLSAITRTSMGPNGMNKLVINHLAKILVTSDAATILQEMEVIHPAAKLLVMSASMQQQELGDGTNLVVTFAGELLNSAIKMLRTGLHTSEIVEGFKKAYEVAQVKMAEQVCHTVTDVRDKEQCTFVLKAVVGAKQYGYEEFLSPMIAEACQMVMPSLPKRAHVNPEQVRVCKIRGGNIMQSTVVKGLVIKRLVNSVIKSVEDGKVAIFACGVEASSTEAKGTVLINNADELMNYNKSEENLLEDSIRAVAESGVKVIISGGSVSEMAMHFVDKYKMFLVRIMSKFELRRICNATGANAMARLGAPTAEEAGHVSFIGQQEIGGSKIVILRQDKDEGKISTIILRASTDNMLDDLERAVDDGVNCMKAMCVDPRFVAGAGASEISLARDIRIFGDSCPGLDQYAIKGFAEALEVVPRTLSENSGQSASDVIASLYRAHASGETTVGVEIEPPCGVADKAKDGILDLFIVKNSALRPSMEAALTVLRVDQIIMAKQAGGPKPR